MHLTGEPASPRLVTVRTGIDHTDGMTKWAADKLIRLEKEDLCGFIFKSKSPSSGIGGIKVYSSSGTTDKGTGIFGGAFMHYFPLIPAIDDVRLHNPDLRENYIERVLTYNRWREFMKKGEKTRELIAFHTDLKLLLLSHSAKHYSALGVLVAQAKKYRPDVLYSEYIKILMEGLRLLATVKKNTNVLQHIAGYFKKRLSSEDKKELLKVIEKYHKGYIPLIVPKVLINHYVRKFNEPYLKTQYYLNPHPMELMLRNHV